MKSNSIGTNFFVSSDGKKSTFCSSLNHYLAGNYYVFYIAIIQPKPSEREQGSNPDNTVGHCPPTLITSSISPPRNRCHIDFSAPTTCPTSLHHPVPNVSTIIEGLQIMTSYAHIENETYVTGWMVCDKLYDQVIDETLADYPHKRPKRQSQSKADY